MRARFGDLFDDARAIHRLALLQFNFQSGVSALGHRYLFNHFVVLESRAADVLRVHETF
jgi:hypothetical protein